MPALLTLLDIAKMNGSDATAGLIEESIQAHPEIMLGNARTINGTQYKTLIRTSIPKTGFRNANEGAAKQKSTYENRLVETFIMNPAWDVDKAVGDSHEDGWETLMATEASGQVEGAMRGIASQFYYGRHATFGDAKGFPGLLAMYDPAILEVDATGTTESTCSSVWAVKFGPQDVSWVWGKNGSLDPEDVRVQSVNDAGGNPYTAYYQELFAYPGLQVGRSLCVGRIKKLTEDSGKGLTDDLLAKLLAKFSTGIRPDVFLMSRRSQEQLRSSRTATTTTGAPAPIPTEAFGVPIQPTDAILDTETLAL